MNWKPGKHLWKVPDYGQKLGDLLGWDQTWKTADGKICTATLV
jgi:hypothetical protein